MAALCPGVQYGLSSQENFGENKDLIFVKLTDSAFRAIEDYLKNQNKFNKSPTIKFLGSEGQLSFPSQHNGSTSFNFSMSSTADMEGPGGGFECAQQSPRGSLGVLGPIPHKIRIHANDDVYETTRHRMTVAEENHKNKCAREIKMNQNDIGRKVKLKQVPGRPVPPIRRDTPREAPPIRENLSSKSAYPASQPSKLISHTNGLSNGLGSNHVSSTKPQNKPSMPDIARRPIKERMVHLLALRPFKKLELFERLTKEGLREKNAMTSVLKQIAFLKDNSYHLNRAMWNDVHEEWPFYTESEKQMLKRRKPQNLTPPGSSDGGSSGSGHSPTSTHPGSPPPPVSSSKRPGYIDGADGLPTKRLRISHYRKPSEQMYRSPVENSERRPMTDSRDASNMNPRSRESPVGGYTPTNGYNMINDKRSISDDEDTASFNRKRACDSHNVDLEMNREKTLDIRSITPPKSIDDRIDLRNNDTRTVDLKFNDTRIIDKSFDITANDTRTIDIRANDIRNTDIRTNEIRNMDIRTNDNRNIDARNKELLSDRTVPITNGIIMNGGRKDDRDRRDKERWNKVSSSTQNNRIARVSPDSQSERISPTDKEPSRNSKLEFPDYNKEYGSIKDVNQRRKYKAEFNADYAEYRELHGVVEKVSRRFAELEERLKQEDRLSSKYKDIKKQIVKEYQLNQQDDEHQRAKSRFQYLHDKLSHIKRLVFEYDQDMPNNQY